MRLLFLVLVSVFFVTSCAKQETEIATPVIEGKKSPGIETSCNLVTITFHPSAPENAIIEGAEFLPNSFEVFTGVNGLPTINFYNHFSPCWFEEFPAWSFVNGCANSEVIDQNAEFIVDLNIYYQFSVELNVAAISCFEEPSIIGQNTPLLRFSFCSNCNGLENPEVLFCDPSDPNALLDCDHSNPIYGSWRRDENGCKAIVCDMTCHEVPCNSDFDGNKVSYDNGFFTMSSDDYEMNCQLKVRTGSGNYFNIEDVEFYDAGTYSLLHADFPQNVKEEIEEFGAFAFLVGSD